MPDEVMSKESRVEVLGLAGNALAQTITRLEHLEQSPFPVVASKATETLIEARNQADDNRVVRAFLDATDAAALKPIADADAATLDESKRKLEASIRTSAIVNANLTFLAQTIETASQVGQILDERPRPKVLAATSSPPETSTQSS